MDQNLRMNVLGPLEVTWNGERLPLKPAGRRILGYLAYRYGGPAQTVEIVDALWPDASEAPGKNRIRVALSAMRNTLASASAPDPIRSLRGAYELDESVCDLDVDEFEGHIRTARTLSRTNTKEAAARYRRALDLFVQGSEPYADLLAYDFAVDENRRLVSLRAAITADLIELEINGAPTQSLIEDIQGALSADPFNERLHAALMIAEYRAGRQSDALRIGQAAREKLADEAGLETHPILNRTETRILNQDPSLLEAVTPIPSSHSQSPRYTTEFIGRDNELTELNRYMLNADVVSAIGPGGSGKTRLVAEGLGSVDRNVVWVDLTRVRRDGDIRPVVAAALGIESAPQDVDSGIDDALRTRKPCLVLDNCEHVLDNAAAFVRRASEIPEIKIVTTSREPLAIDGEVIVRLRGLGVDGTASGNDGLSESAALFVDRARRSGIEIDLTESAIADMERICSWRDGLPLAIELAASWVPFLSLGEIREGLAKHVDLMEDTRRSRLGRSESMEDTIGWSYSLLDERQQLVFRRAALLEHGFTFDLLTLVCSDLRATAVRAAHTRLVSHQLIDRDTTRLASRFSMLQTIKSYGAERANATDRDVVANALAKWARELVEDAWERIDGEDRERLFHTLDEEIGNLLLAARVSMEREDVSIALQLIARLNGFITNRPSLMAETLDLFRRADSFTTDGESEEWVRALIGAGVVSYHAGLLEYASELLGRAIQQARSNDDKLGELNARHSLGRVLVHQAETAQARTTLRKATELSRELGDSTRLARDLSEQASVEPPEMQSQCLTEAADLISMEAQHVTATYVAAQFAWFNLGVLHGKTSAAAFAHALSEYRSRDSEVAIVEMLWGLADCHGIGGEREIEINALREALSVAAHSGDGPSIALSAIRLAEVLEPREAEAMLTESEAAARATSSSLLGRLSLARGRLAVRLTDHEAARVHFRAASEMFAERSYPSWVAAALLGSAMAMKTDHREEARRLASDAAGQLRTSLDGPFLLDGFVFPELGSLAAIHLAIDHLSAIAGVERSSDPWLSGLEGVGQTRSALDDVTAAL